MALNKISEVSSASFNAAEGGVVPRIPGSAITDGTPMNLESR